jgi:putative oxidoreductase
VTTYDTATRATMPTPTVPRSRVATIALWSTQVALAAMFLFAGGSKLVGAPAMVNMFAAIGLGQWFRYLTGIIELSAAIALAIPSVAPFGAILLVATMIGAAAANMFIGQSPAVPVVLALLAAAVAWSRRHQLSGVFPH